jgi:hypothetical protein
MIEVSSREPVIVFRVLDRQGQAIGEVVQPSSAPVIARGGETVLLVRGGWGAGRAPTH